LLLQSEELSVLEGEQEAFSVIDVGLGFEGRLGVPGDDLTVVDLDDEDDLGFVVDVIAERRFVLFVVFVNRVSGLDFLACTGFKGLNKPFLMLFLPDVENTSVEILSVTPAN
jgi:hypothetical protein